MTARPFVVYYGWLTDGPDGEPNGAARRIAAAAPPLLIAQPWTAPPAGHCNLSASVLALIAAAGTEVYAYVATGYGRRAALQSVLADMDAAAARGVQGIFFDEVDPLVDYTKLAFYSTLCGAARVKRMKTIVNTGVARCDQRLMDLSDRLMLEHRWREFLPQSAWARDYDRDRFMGISSNEENAMGYVVDGARATRDARDAWQAGIGWHAATDRYIELPGWL